MLYRHFLRVSIFVLIGASLASARDIALVSNKSNEVGGVTLPELVKVCKAQTNRWPDGKPVTFVMRAPSVPAMKVVLEKVYGMSESEVTVSSSLRTGDAQAIPPSWLRPPTKSL